MTDYEQKFKELEIEYEEYKVVASEIEQEQNELYEALQKEYDKMNMKVSTLNEKISDLKNELKKEQKVIEKLESKNSVLEQKLEQTKEYKTKITELEIENDDYQNKVRFLTAEQESTKQNVDSFIEQIAILQNDVEEKSEQFTKLEEKIQRLKSQLQEKNDDNFAINQKLEKIQKESQGEQEKLNEQLKEKLEYITQLQNKASSSSSQNNFVIDQEKDLKGKQIHISALNSEKDLDPTDQKEQEDTYNNLEQQMVKQVDILQTPGTSAQSRQSMNNTKYGSNHPTVEKGYNKDNVAIDQQSQQTIKYEKHNNVNGDMQSSQTAKKFSDNISEPHYIDQQSMHSFCYSQQQEHKNKRILDKSYSCTVSPRNSKNNLAGKFQQYVNTPIQLQQQKQQQHKFSYSNFEQNTLQYQQQNQQHINSIDFNNNSMQTKNNNPRILRQTSQPFYEQNLSQELSTQFNNSCGVQQQSQLQILEQLYLQQQQQQINEQFQQFTTPSQSQKSSFRTIYNYTPNIDKIKLNSIGLKSSIDMVASIIKDIDSKMKKLKDKTQNI